MYSVLVGLLMTLAVHAGVYHSRDIIKDTQQQHASTDLVSDNPVQENDAENKGTEKHDLMGQNTAARRGMAQDKSWLWPNGIVYWQFDSTLDNVTVKEEIRDAMKHFEDKTCIRFKRRTNQKGYINFVYGKYCAATVGYIPGLALNVTISKTGFGCPSGRMVHELGHVIGFYHEQSRADRDNYVRINYTNVDNETRPSFEKYNLSIDSRNIPYDYASVMHYSRYFLAKDPRYPTVIPTRRNCDGSEVKIGYAKYLSPLDIMQANLLYNCNQGSGPRQRYKESKSSSSAKEPQEEQSRIQI